MASGEIDPNWPPPVYQPSDNIDTTPPSSQPGVRGGSGRVIWLVVALVAAVCVGVVAIIAYSARRQPAASPPATTAATAPATTSATTPVATSPTSAPPGSCGPDEAAALATLPPDKKTGRPWNPTPEFSDYDLCAELSAVVVTVVDATRSSPDEALMFHRGQFVGTATPEAYPFTQLEAPASTDDLVVLTYRSRQSCDACEDGVLTVVGFQWQGDHVQMLDPPPDPWDSPP
ncbi:hypothetical protein CKW46_27540 [Mycobacterium liflandii]|nr:hypothetical protein CKW46_27540 [Mycobacterium liflandii]